MQTDGGSLLLLIPNGFNQKIYNTISFIDKTKKVRIPADTAATQTITRYIGIWKIRKSQLKKL